MPGTFYSFVYLPVVAWLVGLCLLVVGSLLSLEIKHFLAKRRLRRQRERFGPQGLAVLVRGLGFRSEVSPGLDQGVLASQNWTPEMDTVSQTDSSRCVTLTPPTRQIRPGSTKRAGANIRMAWPNNLDFLESAGRG